MLLKLTNYFEHPSERNYLVFQFYNLTMAEAFQDSLLENNIPFERDDEETIPKRVLFGVHRTYTDKAKYLNNVVIGKHRKPFIDNPYLKWGILIIVGFTITLSIVGYIKHASV